MKKSTSILLFFAGVTGIGVGAAQLFIPVTFEASAGITLGENSSLLSEIRAAGGTLLTAGIVILCGAFSNILRYRSLLFSTVFYLSYGLSRLLSWSLDGPPAVYLQIATAAELILGVLSAIALYQKIRRSRL